MVDQENQMPQAPKVSAQRKSVEGDSGYAKGRWRVPLLLLGTVRYQRTSLPFVREFGRYLNVSVGLRG